MLGDLYARSGGVDRLELAAIFRAGFQIPDVDRRWSTATPQQDAGFVVFTSGRSIRFNVLDKIHRRNRRGGASHMAHEMSS